MGQSAKMRLEYLLGRDPLFEYLAELTDLCWLEYGPCANCYNVQRCRTVWDRKVVLAATLGTLEKQYLKIRGRLLQELRYLNPRSLPEPLRQTHVALPVSIKHMFS